MCTACAPHVHRMCTACAPHVHRNVHRMCIACARHVHRMCTPCAPHVHRTCTTCAVRAHCTHAAHKLHAHCTHTARKLHAHCMHSLTCMQSAASFVLSLTAEQLSIEQADFQQLLAPRLRSHSSTRPEPRLRLGWRRTGGQATATRIGQVRAALEARPEPRRVARVWRASCPVPLALCLSPCARHPVLPRPRLRRAPPQPRRGQRPRARRRRSSRLRRSRRRRRRSSSRSSRRRRRRSWPQPQPSEAAPTAVTAQPSRRAARRRPRGRHKCRRRCRRAGWGATDHVPCPGSTLWWRRLRRRGVTRAARSWSAPISRSPSPQILEPLIPRHTPLLPLPKLRPSPWPISTHH